MAPGGYAARRGDGLVRPPPAPSESRRIASAAGAGDAPRSGWVGGKGRRVTASSRPARVTHAPAHGPACAQGFSRRSEMLPSLSPPREPRLPPSPVAKDSRHRAGYLARNSRLPPSNHGWERSVVRPRMALPRVATVWLGLGHTKAGYGSKTQALRPAPTSHGRCRPAWPSVT